MAAPLLPLVIEPAEFVSHLGNDALFLVDLSRVQVYNRGHVPSAVHLDYNRIVHAQPPAMGLIPDAEHLSAVFSEIGLTPEHHVVAYDDEGNGKAARLLFTLDAIGHERFSLLNGGLVAWQEEDLPQDNETPSPRHSHYPVTFRGQAVADKDYVLKRLRDPQVALLDVRTPEEYQGEVRRATRGGHIPGAVNFNWTEAMDQERGLRLKSAPELTQVLRGLGVTPDKEVIAYCQTHHRSAHTYIVLKYLGFPRVRGYPGSWSEWGNIPELPIE